MRILLVDHLRLEIELLALSIQDVVYFNCAEIKILIEEI